ncbi:40-residue YVTN family beta-propeller repeat-containing protein [Micromonospora eburnea]|uniref:40-residue YVTN family beta-propeller repeat-containing protein n=2 Tax=Micromonospora eburnea TaxID=227316 RepID=A0A1C6UGA4_9ACTN|nr:40-residue YVTN family beta-propeller repeat-containing protein [Micromonospora eburnea]
MPAYPNPGNVYAGAGPNMLAEPVRADKALVYVPNTNSDDVSVIDPNTYRVVGTFPGGPEPQHVIPSYNLRTLYVASDEVPDGGLVPVDPRTGKPGAFRKLEDVYNLYFTPDGRQAIVVAEAYQRLDFYDLASWQRVRSVRFPECKGVNHMDYSADGKIMMFSCEFANRMLVLDTASLRKLREFTLPAATDGMPQDTRLTPDGQHFLVADMHANGVYVFDAQATRQTGFVPTGKGAHGIYFSRDGKLAYVTNRDAGSITVLDLATLKPATTWKIPGGGSPDMGSLSADGTTLWLSGRYHNEVYALRTSDGKLLARIPVGKGPHGLTIWPQPGRYSLGHTANIR